MTSARIERSLRQRLLAAYRHGLPFEPVRVIVGFSGGTDSLALALLLASIQPAIRSSVELLHIDHLIRSGSAADAEACQRLADAIHLPMRSVRLTAHPQELYPGVGLEEAARRARYRVFSGVADPGDVIALAHQAGDQAETMLLHLMHGTGVTGLAGMRSLSHMQVPWWSNHEDIVPLTIWRPLLREQRSDLAQVVNRYGLEPIHDLTNDDVQLKRNAIRHVALPALRAVEPSIDKRLGNLARIVSDEDDLLQHLTGEAFASACLPGGDLSTRTLAALPIALARRVVRRWLDAALGFVPSLDRVEAVIDLARTEDQAAITEIGGGLVAGCFNQAIRCGTAEHLRHRAWTDARLALPLEREGALIDVTGDTISIGGTFSDREPLQRRLGSNGAIAVRRVRWAESADKIEAWNDWFRRAGVSPWIRDLVQGIAVDDVMWWIPRVGDYDGPDGGRLVRVIWKDRE